MTPPDPVSLRWLALLVVLAAPRFAMAVAPAAPSGCYAFTLNPVGANASIAINWTDNSTTETKWKIQVSVNSGAYTDLATVDSTSTAATGPTGVTWGAASINTTYRFKVLAGNGTEFSAPSNIATVGTYPLNGPVNLNVTALDPFNVTMNWEEGSTSETGFSLERRVGAGSWEILGTLSANTLSLPAYNLIYPDDTFSFRVRAYQGGAPTIPDAADGATAVSAYSNTASVNSGAYTLTATAVPGQPAVDLSWPNVLNESGYRIYILVPGAGQYQVLDSVAADVTTYQATSPVIEPAATYSFVVCPYDAQGIIGESSEAAVLVDGITSKTGASGNPGDPFSHTFTHVSDSTVSSRALAGAPSTLTFNAGTGELTGTYPPLGNYTLEYTLTLASGGILTQTFHVRVRPPAGPPGVGAAIGDWTGAAGTSRDTPLAGTFTDAEAESAVRVATTVGDMDFILFDAATPATVANFMNYVNTGKYTDVVFHRSIANFVIQGGGFKGAGTGSDFTSVATDPPVANEPGIANVRGTLSMAKVGGDPNSATSQFFVSLGDNTANLDHQNGGFTVFGRVAGGGMAVADAIGNLPTGTYNLFVDGNATATRFDDIPMNDSVLPDPMDQSKLVKILSVAPVPTLAYSVTGNTAPAVASASIVGGQLHLAGLAGGQTTITVTATDLDHLTASQTIVVTLSDTFASWASRQTFPGGQAGAMQDPERDGLPNLLEYAFVGDPAACAGTAVPSRGIVEPSPGVRFLTLTFPVRKFTTGLRYTVEANNHLSGSWTPVWSSADGFTHAQVVAADDQADRTVVTIKDTAALGSQPGRFLRVRVTEP